jgi:hypothetical protein
VFHLVAGSLVTLLVAAGPLHAEPPKPRVAKHDSANYDLAELTVAAFALRDGGFGEVGLCSAKRDGVVSTYACMSIDLGKQHDAWVGGEVVEWGVRVQPISRLWLKAGGGFSLLTAFVNGIGCAFATPAGADGPSDMPGSSSRSCDAILPMQAYPTASAHVAVPVSSVDIVLSGAVRYIVASDSRVGQAPSGVAIAFGAGLSF